MQALVQVLYVGTEAGERRIQGWGGIDIIDGAGRQRHDQRFRRERSTSLVGQGNDLIDGGEGAMTFLQGGQTAMTTCKGYTGDDVMEGGDGDDTFYDTVGREHCARWCRQRHDQYLGDDRRWHGQ